MAITKMELMELVRHAEGGDVDFLRDAVRVLAQAPMEGEVSARSARRTANATPRAVPRSATATATVTGTRTVEF